MGWEQTLVVDLRERSIRQNEGWACGTKRHATGLRMPNRTKSLLTTAHKFETGQPDQSLEPPAV